MSTLRLHSLPSSRKGRRIGRILAATLHTIRSEKDSPPETSGLLQQSRPRKRHHSGSKQDRAYRAAPNAMFMHHYMYVLLTFAARRASRSLPRVFVGLAAFMKGCLSRSWAEGLAGYARKATKKKEYWG